MSLDRSGNKRRPSDTRSDQRGDVVGDELGEGTGAKEGTGLLTLCRKMQARGPHPGTDGCVVDPSIGVFLKVLRTTYMELCESGK